MLRKLTWFLFSYFYIISFCEVCKKEKGHYVSLYDCVCGGDRAITLLSYQRVIHFSTTTMNKNINEIKNDTLRCHFLGTVIILGGKITTSVYYHELNDLSRVKHFEIQRKIISLTRFFCQNTIIFLFIRLHI